MHLYCNNAAFVLYVLGIKGEKRTDKQILCKQVFAEPVFFHMFFEVVSQLFQDCSFTFRHLEGSLGKFDFSETFALKSHICSLFSSQVFRGSSGKELQYLC